MAVAAFALLHTACSCGSGRAGADGAPADARGDRPEWDLGVRDSAGPDVTWLHPGHPEEDWIKALDVPWKPDGTRQVSPIEIAPVVSATPCGPSCKQVTFLPGGRKCTTFGDAFSVDGDFLTTSIQFATWMDGDGTTIMHCLQVYVDLRTLKSYAFGSVVSGPGWSVCGSASVTGGRIAYACTGGPQTAGPGRRSELRLFDIESGTERLLWGTSVEAELDQASATAFAADQVAAMRSPGCVGGGCSTIILYPLGGGVGTPIYPPTSAGVGGLAGLVASYPYLVTFDMQRYWSAGLRTEVVAIDLREPGQVINVSNFRADQFNPRVSGSRVAWVDARNDPTGDRIDSHNTDIFAKDVASGQEWAVCVDPARQDSPDIEGDVVVWMDFRNSKYPNPPASGGDPEPYLLNLAGGTEQRIELPPAGGGRDSLRINNGRAFYRWLRAEWTSDQVFMIDLRELGLVP